MNMAVYKNTTNTCDFYFGAKARKMHKLKFDVFLFIW